MTYDKLVRLFRDVLCASRTLTDSDSLAVLETEKVLGIAEIAALRCSLDPERIREASLLAELSPIVAQAEQVLEEETRTALIDHDTGCDGQTVERVTELTCRGHRIAPAIRQLRAFYRALAELHDAVGALRDAHRLVSGR